VLQKPLTAHRYLKSAEKKINIIKEFANLVEDEESEESTLIH